MSYKLKQFFFFQLSVIQGDISTVDCDAIVHPTNANFSFTGEVGEYKKYYFFG